VVADVQYLCRRHTQAGAGGMEDARLRLGRAVFARAQLEGEMMGQADPLQIGIAVAQRCHRYPRGNPRQRIDRIGVALDLVARGEEDFIRRLQQLQAGSQQPAGGKAIAVISDEAKRQFCLDHGAVGVINRKDFSHWGTMPDTNSPKWGAWFKGAREFGKAFWEAAGDKVSPSIVFEHSGEATLPTSGFLCGTGGMIVICAGTSGYNVTLDLRYHWMRQKRFQGSHLSNDPQAEAVNQLVIDGKVDPCLSQTFTFDEIGKAHQLMHENRHPHGNMAALVNATAPGQGAS